MKNRQEYPRPNFVREDWKNLNGAWQFSFSGEEEIHTIQVPFVYQSALSGVEVKEVKERVVYERTFTVPTDWKGRNICLHFGAVDYYCEVYVNDIFCGSHEGGSTPFFFDITEKLNWKEETVVARVYDPLADETIPRGKQYWNTEPEGIWYTQTTGIWQTVWLEPLGDTHIASVFFTPDVDRGDITMEYTVDNPPRHCSLTTEIFFKDLLVLSNAHTVEERYQKTTHNLFNQKIFRTPVHNDGWCWTPDNPNLFDVVFTLREGEKVIDRVESYFGMRKVSTDGANVMLNNRPFYQKLVLDQGYWKNSLMTAPTDEAFQKDIQLAKAMGFNGCRKHQKVEDPRFLYWADTLGFVVWGEIPSAPSFSQSSVKRTTNEWFDVIQRDYNHPSIVAWVTLNESWGAAQINEDTRQEAHSLGLYYTVKSLDSTRLVISNDGWEMTKTDITAVHSYSHGGTHQQDIQKEFAHTLATADNLLQARPSGRPLYVSGYEYENTPIVLSEFGGVAFAQESGGWGYTATADEEEFIATYRRLIEAIYASDSICGFCYTQLTDVEQEQNGLLTAAREYKCDPKEILKIHERWHRTMF